MREKLLLLPLVMLVGCMDAASTELPSRMASERLGPVPIVGLVPVGPGCALPLSSAVRLPTVVDIPNAYTGNSPDPATTAMKAWADRVMRLSSNARISTAANETLRAELLAAARGGAMTWPANWNQGDHRPPSVVYHTMETLFPAQIAYIQQRESFSPQERAVFEAWSGEIVARLGRTDQVRNWTLDNKKYQYGAVLAAQGVMTGDSGMLSQSRRIYATAMRGMRSDGSLPGDSGRGGSALHYTNLAIANLVAIAELNAAAGHDLYGDPQRGGTIHAAILFLARATQDPKLIAGYANTPNWQDGSFSGYTPDNQDRRWANSNAALWGNYYLARFGNTAGGQSLRGISPHLQQRRSGVHQQAGGNARCFTG